MDLAGCPGNASTIKEKAGGRVDRVGMRDAFGIRTRRKQESDLVQRGELAAPPLWIKPGAGEEGRSDQWQGRWDWGENQHEREPRGISRPRVDAQLKQVSPRRR